MATKKPTPSTANEAQPPETSRVALQPARLLASTQAQLADAREFRAALLRELAQGSDKHVELDAIDSEIALHEKTLQRVTEARALQVSQDTKEAKAAQREKMRASLQDALNDARVMGDEVKGVLNTVAELGTRLGAVAAKRDAIRVRIAAALPNGGERTMEEQANALARALRDISLPDHLTRCLYASGIGRTGIELDSHFFRLLPLGASLAQAGTEDPDKSIALAVDNLKALANKALRAQS